MSILSVGPHLRQLDEFVSITGEFADFEQETLPEAKLGWKLYLEDDEDGKTQISGISIDRKGEETWECLNMGEAQAKQAFPEISNEVTESVSAFVAKHLVPYIDDLSVSADVEAEFPTIAKQFH